MTDKPIVNIQLHRRLKHTKWHEMKTLKGSVSSSTMDDLRKRVFRNSHIRLFIVLTVMLACNHCVTSVKESPDTRTASDIGEKSVAEKKAESESKLIKPSISDDSPTKTTVKQRKEPEIPKTGVEAASAEKPSNVISASQDPKKDKPVDPPRKRPAKPIKIPEIVKVKNAALEMGKNMSSVENIKVCLNKTTNEYWVTFYDDIGPLIDIKQYVWEAESETLTPFLVLKRIPKSRLDTHLTVTETDRECEVIDNPGRKKIEPQSEEKTPNSDETK